MCHYYTYVAFNILEIEVVSKPDDYVTTISSEDQRVPKDYPFASIEIPYEVVLDFADEGTVRAASFLLYNAENLFPSGFPGMENE